MPEMYCLVADVLGFQQIMKNVPPDARSTRVDDWLHVAMSAGGWQLDSQIVSDTVFVVAPPDADGLTRLVELSRSLLEQGMHRYLPIRGAIARGDVEKQSGALWGSGIVEAYERGQGSDWIGITLSDSIVDVPRPLYDSRQLILYPTPMKSGSIVLYPCVNWSIPKVSELAGFTTRGFLTKPNETLGWSWLKKVDATSVFAIYKDLATRGDFPADHYYGLSTSALTEAFITLATPHVPPDWSKPLR